MRLGNGGDDEGDWDTYVTLRETETRLSPTLFAMHSLSFSMSADAILNPPSLSADVTLARKVIVQAYAL